MITVAELRERLIELGVDKSEAQAIKGKGNLQKAVAKLEKTPNPVQDDEDDEDEDDGFVLEIESPFDEDIENDGVPAYNEDGWADYVMSQFKEDELVEGNPTIVGLRRVAENLLGPIVESGPVSLQSNTLGPDIPPQSACTFRILFDWMLSGEGRTFVGAGGSWLGNSDEPYSLYPEALAETRAEARALRRALKLGQVSHEELTTKKVEDVLKMKDKTEWDENDPISSVQINFLKTNCDRLGIDLDKFINSGASSYGSVEEIKRGVASKMIEEINRYLNAGEDSKDIPVEILKNSK